MSLEHGCRMTVINNEDSHWETIAEIFNANGTSHKTFNRWDPNNLMDMFDYVRIMNTNSTQWHLDKITISDFA